jgi:hypothetical protein
LLLEAFSESPGRQAAIDRLFEYLFVLLIRSAMDAQQVNSGVLLGLSYSRLSGAIEAMHKHPETSWTLEELAQAAGMFQHQVAVSAIQVLTPISFTTVATGSRFPFTSRCFQNTHR